MNLVEALVRGRLPKSPGEFVISEKLAESLGARVGDTATLIGATAHGSMAVHNLTVVGTIRFGIGALDRRAILVDIADVQYALDMEDRASEILGFFPNLVYDDEAATGISQAFNARFSGMRGEFSPVMRTLGQQNGLGEYLAVVDTRITIVLVGFVIVMSIVLWNTGLMSGLRRYGEIGIRLAVGESKGHVYGFLIGESLLVGMAGSIAGTALGLAVSYYLQEVGLDISGMVQGSTALISDVMRARITPTSFHIGFVPGLLATLLGTAISGIGVFRRQTSHLFKELEV